MPDNVLDPDLYAKAKKKADKLYAKPSAYKSGFIVQEYKRLGGRYKNTRSEKPLKRWFQEKWRDVNPDKTDDSYPVYRPTRRISPKTPKTVQELSQRRLKLMAKLKQIYRGKKNLPKF